MAWPKNMAIVEVLWIDSQATAGWQSEETFDRLTDDSDPEDGYCRTAGYLYKDTTKNITIAQNVSHNGNLGDVIQIPKVAIVDIMAVVRERVPTEQVGIATSTLAADVIWSPPLVPSNGGAQ